jgi:CMP-N,N'-diacetyllegionaminic acid synthase
MIDSIAVLLARGGSKEIPKKNIIDIAGRPMISYGIEAAIMAGIETWVSTDSKEIADISKSWGAKVIMRPPELATDKSSSEEALLHFAENFDFNKLIFIQPTSPLIKSKHILDALKMMKNYDSVFSAYKEHWVPRWITYDSKRYYPNRWSINNRPMRQDVGGNIHGDIYVENGAFYITRKDYLLYNKMRYSGKIGLYEMKFSESFQVDSYDDLRIIESIMNNRK